MSTTELITNIVNNLLNDDNFVNDCKTELQEIMKDGKFDFNDMPQVIALVVLVYEKYDNLHVEKKDVADVFRLLIIELLKKLGWLTEENDQVKKMLESCLTLLMLKIQTKKCNIFSIFKKLNLCNCCVKCKC